MRQDDKVRRTAVPPELAKDPAFHIEQAIGSLHDAIWRVVRGVECLDLGIIQSAREKLDAADRSLLTAIELRGKR